MAARRTTYSERRYTLVTHEKAGGAVYTPRVLADFLSEQIAKTVADGVLGRSLRILDPAIGHGELLASLLNHLSPLRKANIEVYGFETDPEALSRARQRFADQFPDIPFSFAPDNFLESILPRLPRRRAGGLFHHPTSQCYDLVVANPPYVRTQIMGAKRARLLSEAFNLSGRIDLYYAFVLGICHVLTPQGTAGIIVSNRFMTTKSGASVRRVLQDRFSVRHAWDLGDTKLFEAAVLPAVVLVQRKNRRASETPAFTSIYQTSQPATRSATDAIAALKEEGVIEVNDGRRFHVRQGTLDTNGRPDGVWRIATERDDTWLNTVNAHTWGTFRDIGKVRVGVKTCADRVFIREDWQDMAEVARPELLRPLITHHVARRFKSLASNRPSQILYPHEVVDGRRRAVDLARYPRSHAYLKMHRPTLEGRRYVMEAGRRWYEIWVPQDPRAWNQPKLVCRDIAEKPTFWIDLNGSIVNGDCYWLVAENPTKSHLLWLAAAISNSTLIERFYDVRFHNKLYAGRRRFITQYVENFPLPDPNKPLSESIIAKTKQVYEHMPSSFTEALQQELDAMVWEALTGGASPGERSVAIL